MSQFLRLLRFPNLVIVALTQYLLRWMIFKPYFDAEQIPFSLGEKEFFLLVLSTVLVAAGGYVINDIFDYPIDKINKPNKVFIGKFITIKTAYILYFGLNIVGALVALYLAIMREYVALWLLYPMAMAWLYWYSSSLKKKVLSGNFTVALFCALVAVLVIFSERAAFNILQVSNPQSATILWNALMAYTAFAFLSTMLREIVKDIEDLQGDQLHDCKTLPIVYGVSIAKNVASLCGILFGILLVFLSYHFVLHQYYFSATYALLAVLIPLVFVLLLLQKADKKTDYRRLSALIKWLMLTGVLYLLLFWYEVI